MKITFKIYMRAFMVISVPLTIFSFLYGYHGFLLYFFGFTMGMMFQAETTPLEFVKDTLDILRRNIKFYKCRILRHKLVQRIEHPYLIQFMYCEKCQGYLRVK